ncbi:MAG: type II toxin-antitoxin system PemK/MazF family toxin [Acidobacteriota bacterium]|nr:type II toxin-antitoxin system PemK/MazF family toxin [Acidobacteriota bacterium]
MVVQSNSFNAAAIQAVVIAGITSNLALAQVPGNVRLSKSSVGLNRACVVDVFQLLTLDRLLLDEWVALSVRVI